MLFRPIEVPGGSVKIAVEHRDDREPVGDVFFEGYRMGLLQKSHRLPGFGRKIPHLRRSDIRGDLVESVRLLAFSQKQRILRIFRPVVVLPHVKDVDNIAQHHDLVVDVPGFFGALVSFQVVGQGFGIIQFVLERPMAHDIVVNRRDIRMGSSAEKRLQLLDETPCRIGTHVAQQKSLRHKNACMLDGDRIVSGNRSVENGGRGLNDRVLVVHFIIMVPFVHEHRQRILAGIGRQVVAPSMRRRTCDD